jgi:hypothetical protein
MGIRRPHRPYLEREASRMLAKLEHQDRSLVYLAFSWPRSIYQPLEYHFQFTYLYNRKALLSPFLQWRRIKVFLAPLNQRIMVQHQDESRTFSPT